MSKSRGNVINPDDVVNEYVQTPSGSTKCSSATLKERPLESRRVRGCCRFLDRFWKLQEMVEPGAEYSSELETKMHQTIKKVSEDYENLKFNTAIAAQMALLNDILQGNHQRSRE